MNKANYPHDVIVSGIHLELTEGLKAHVREKMERLFRHESHIVRLKVELECDRKHDHEHQFIAKGHIILHGPAHLVLAGALANHSLNRTHCGMRPKARHFILGF